MAQPCTRKMLRFTKSCSGEDRGVVSGDVLLYWFVRSDFPDGERKMGESEAQVDTDRSIAR